MVNRFFHTFIFLFFIVTCYSQQRLIYIQDSITKEAIPLAALQFIDKKGGIYTDDNGKGIIPDSVNSILISQIGYDKKHVNLAQNANSITIYLQKANIILPEVIVTNISSQIKEIGYTNFRGNNGLIASPNINFAVYIPFDNKWQTSPNIISIIAFLDDIKGSKKFPSAKCNICYDLRLPNHNGEPSEVSLIGKKIIANSTKIYKGKEIVKLENPILFPKEGVFIVIDFIVPNNPAPRLLINPTINVTGGGRVNQTWSRNIIRDFRWEKIDLQNKDWGNLINKFYGKDATIMNLRAGVQIKN